jgi:hypothetical protein
VLNPPLGGIEDKKARLTHHEIRLVSLLVAQ